MILGGAEDEFKAFIEKSGIPSAWTILGIGAIPGNHPLNVGMLGMHGNYAPNILTNECDLLIAIGMRFDDRVTGRLDKYAKQAKVIHLDIDPAEIDKNVKATVPVWGDCKETLPMLTALIEKKEHAEWLGEFQKRYKEELDTVINPELYPTSVDITMGEVMRNLNELTKGEAVIVSDVGQNQMVTCRYAKMDKTRTNVTSGGLGTMGFALPAAIGAKYGAPEKTVIAIAGDGGFQMTLQELGTIMQNKIDVKIIILNNRFLGMIRQWQELFSDSRYSFSDLENPDFVALAASYRIKGKWVSDRDELPGALSEMMSSSGAFLLEVMVTKENNVFPMVPQGCSLSEIRLK
ncbi:acetolactate synthase-1/2/3 large subunit [Mucilaginibacter gossypiicola]|uniref:Acetolactate synthase-1/2/3 large subunit n=1 Tax=Mucilaginibacter gossypiicola TaxID=551995 RepID=A0A1H8AQF0_9SPHI|nr:acetolactate synthase-1/2/3 large subunit [Mucilaginibacter gossypiicola]